MNTRLLSLVLRYCIIFSLGLANLALFYFIFTPLTVYPVYWILRLFNDVVLVSDTVLLIDGVFASIVPACIAGAAYYLLSILNLTTPLTPRKRVYSLLFLLSSFLFINILRIVFFATLFVRGYQYFDLTHTASWYFGSTILVILLWFGSVALFNIRDIPFITDVRLLLKHARKN